MNTAKPAVSIVICFRDWGVDRLRVAVESHFLNARIAGIAVEVIVSDYGSTDKTTVLEALDGTGAKVVYTPSSDLPWNRSASLNAGVEHAAAEWVVTTDADIVFTPATIPHLLKRVAEAPDVLYLIQCRDLPSNYGCETIAGFLGQEKWARGIGDALDQSSIRPRWGMGGFAAFSRRLFTVLNGYEERMKIWGGEDNDFATRSRRAGFPVRWLSDPSVAILHVWHEPSQKKAIETEDGRNAVENNRRILREDVSIVRNLPRVVARQDAKPLVSVVIPTYRRPELLARAIASVQQQTFHGWELIVVENGDSHVSEGVVGAFDDSRIRFVKIPQPGAAAARNRGVEVARGEFVVIHDDDDIMVRTRIEDHLAALGPSMHGTYSGWIDFDGASFDVTGIHSGKAFSFEAVLCNGKVLTHGALMLRRSIFERFRYEEDLSAGIDYGFVLLLARNGLRLNHTGRMGILRCMHGGNMTAVDSVAQKAAGVRMATLIKGEIPEASYKEFRARGLAAEALECANVEDALSELTMWPRWTAKELKGEAEKVSPLEVFVQREVRDESLGNQMVEGDVVRADPAVMSHAALSFLRFRRRLNLITSSMGLQRK